MALQCSKRQRHAVPCSSSCSAAPFSHEVGVQANHLVVTVGEHSSGRQQNKKAQPIKLADVPPYSGDIASHSVHEVGDTSSTTPEDAKQ